MNTHSRTQVNPMQTSLKVQCCVCHRYRENGDWVHEPNPPVARVSHTYCPRCLSLMGWPRQSPDPQAP